MLSTICDNCGDRISVTSPYTVKRSINGEPVIVSFEVINIQPYRETGQRPEYFVATKHLCLRCLGISNQEE